MPSLTVGLLPHTLPHGRATAQPSQRLPNELCQLPTGVCLLPTTYCLLASGAGAGSALGAALWRLGPNMMNI